MYFLQNNKKEIPASIIHEDDKFIGFLDINPVVKGHSLLIPKDHHQWVHETPDELLAEFSIVMKNIINKMIKGLGCDYVETVVDGVHVPHFHTHLIPRLFNDGLPEFKRSEYENDEEKNSIANKIK